jgi:hypothetical protein
MKKQDVRSTATAVQPNVHKSMMDLEAAKQRAERANKASLGAEQAKDAAEKEVEQLLQILHLK